MQSSQVLNLCRGLYGSKKSPGLWHEKSLAFMNSMEFSRLVSDNCAFRRGKKWLLLYVDDIIVTGEKNSDIQMVKEELIRQLDVQDMGRSQSFLAVAFSQDAGRAVMLQPGYMQRILSPSDVTDCKPATTAMCAEALKTFEQSCGPATDTQVCRVVEKDLAYFKNQY